MVENKPGAGGTIASNDVAKAAKDGYTATMISTGHTISAVMLKSQPYDAVKDFAPVALVANSAFVVVARKDFPANDLKGLVALAKASPGKLNFASVGLGSTQHFAGELLAQSTGIKVTHVPYRGTPALMTALLAGQVDYGVELAHAVQGQVQAGSAQAAGRRHARALADHPRCADGRRAGRARLFRHRLVWLGLSGRHAAGDRRQDLCRDQRGDRASGGARAARQGRRRGASRGAGANSASISPTRSPNGKRCATKPGLNRNSRAALSVDHQ